MIHLDNSTTEQYVLLPRTGLEVPDADEQTLTLRSTVNARTEDSEDVTIDQPDPLHIGVRLTLPDGLPDGEYDYRLTMDGVTVGSGLALIGSLDSPFRRGSGIPRNITFNQL